MRRNSLGDFATARSKMLCALCSVLICFPLLIFISSYASAGGQSIPTSNATQTQRRDAWRKIPVTLPPPPSDSEQTQLLEARGKYFDSMPGGSGVPLDQPQPPGNGGYSLSYMPEAEFPFFKDEAIVVGTFSNYEVHLTPSHLSLYTDIKITVEQALEPGPTSISKWDTIDVLDWGGAAILAGGKIVETHTYNDFGDFSLQPGRRYVLFLRYHSEGSFFTDHKDWLLSDGVALPNSAWEASRVRDGTARYSGLQENAFVEALRKKIQQHQAGE